MRTVAMLFVVGFLTIVYGCGDTYITEPSAQDGGIGGSTVSASVASSSTGTAPNVCGPGKKACGSECVSINDTATGCGGPTCDPCNTPHAVSVCANQACAVSQCVGGWHDCDGKPDNGCESDPGSDSHNCGACGNACTSANAALGVCSNGSCFVGQCLPGYANCDVAFGDGCEIDTTSDANNCNGCTIKCAAGLGCDAGKCHACGRLFNWKSPSTTQIPSGFFFAFKYVPSHNETVTQICVKAGDPGKSYKIAVMSDNSGPSSYISTAPAFYIAPEQVGVICTPTAPGFLSATLIAGATYWIASSAYGPIGDPAGEQVDYYVSDSPTFGPSATWFADAKGGFISKIVASCD